MKYHSCEATDQDQRTHTADGAPRTPPPQVLRPQRLAGEQRDRGAAAGERGRARGAGRRALGIQR